MKGDQIDREGWSVPLKYTLVSNSAEGLFGGISEFIENTTLRLILKQKAIKGKDYWKIKLLSSSNFEKLCLPDTNI